MNSDRRRLRSISLPMLLSTMAMVGACSRAPEPATDLQDVSPDAAEVAATVGEGADGQASAAQVDDSELMSQWARNCALCHVRGEGGAPRVGDVDAWRSRVAQGEAMLLAHTVEGLNNMPPLGYCMDCESDDFAALIRFMAGTVLADPTSTEEAEGT